MSSTFKYTAINNENKKLSGFINAISEENARIQLNDLGLAVLSIQIVDETQDTKEENDKKLKFEALDKSGKKIIGTIPETDLKSAYKRLIEEYSFQVLALYKMDATEEEKQQARINIEDISASYDVIKAEKDAPDILTDKEKDVRSKLLKEVEFVIIKVNEVLQKFGDSIKPEEKKHIEQIEDKLLRLKNSNNLNFIKQTSEELLKSIQEKEIYLQQDGFVQERDRIKLDTQKLLLEIHKLDTNPNIGLFNEDINISEGKLSFFKKFLKKESVEVEKIKNEMKLVNGQILDYIRIWLKAPKTLKSEVKTEIRELRFKKKDLKTQLKSVLKSENLEKHHDHHSELDSDLIIITGWLLTFYIAYYFINYYLTFKSIFLNEKFYWQTNIFLSPVFTYLILTVFLLHISLQTKRFFMKENKMFNYISYSLIILVILFVNINF
ncbi:MAG: hypothetical protein Q8P68_04600 [Candidatus Peregrinibacteria bacterium]|nr:hypothetical protein [Candidatus Peregrinibacteria bacterium]MDZ4244882.1 hypothetical protein [Candidatus Gracilibacteria bacterium]